ncbi:MAG: iron-sulfur cluster assembly accessory protein [Cellvibrio sp.]|jgi:Iron-sulfur cluster assembly accessory protein
MTVESFDPVQQAVAVTPAAVEHFKRQLVNHKEAKAIRLSVKQSGCTGYMYVVDLVPEGQADDLRYTLADGVDLLVDKSSLSVVSGTQIDFVTEGVNRQLKFLNPNAKDYCGCGESFNVN